MYQALFEECLRRVFNLNQAAAAHFKNADFAGRAEAVLDAAQQAIMLKWVTLEIKYGIDNMLQDAGTGDIAVFGDMAD